MESPESSHGDDTTDLGEPDNVILTGFMATGKSTVGRLLADRLGQRWVDTDDLIESRHGPIPEIFAQHGEAAFRQYEREVAVELSFGRGQVISTGGRLMLDPDNARLLEPTGPVFCLVASPESILERIGGTDRPLLAGPDVRGRITGLLEEREHGYSRFQQIITDGKDTDEIVDEIVAHLERL